MNWFQTWLKRNKLTQKQAAEHTELSERTINAMANDKKIRTIVKRGFLYTELMLKGKI